MCIKIRPQSQESWNSSLGIAGTGGRGDCPMLTLNSLLAEWMGHTNTLIPKISLWKVCIYDFSEIAEMPSPIILTPIDHCG